MDRQIHTYSSNEFQIENKYKISHYYYQTPAGILEVSIADFKIVRAEFANNSVGLNGPVIEVADAKLLPLLLVGTPLQLKVWQALSQIPVGKTVSYYELACMVGYPRAWRAVATAVGQNKISYFIPCHRVVRKNGDLGGYRWGVEKKKALLNAEGVISHT